MNEENISYFSKLSINDNVNSLDTKGLNFFSKFKRNKESKVQQNIPNTNSQIDVLKYSMKSKYRGKCVIINNYNFDSVDLSKREGTDVDKRKLTESFSVLGFHIENWDDKNASDIKTNINKLSKEDFSQHGDSTGSI